MKIGTWKIGQIATQNDLTILSCRYSGNAVIEVHHYALIPLSTCGPRVLQRDPMGLRFESRRDEPNIKFA